MGIDREGLLAEVARYNEFVRNGVDRDWHRGESQDAYDTMMYAATGFCALPGADNTDLTGLTATMGTIEKGPFYCCRYVPGSCGTRGGLVVNGNSQVINQEGSVIEGLYAAGCCSTGVAGYWAGGACIAQGCVMSYVAAKHAMGR